MPEEMFFLKVHEVGKEVLVAICDMDLIGETLIHNGVRIKISEYFYGKEDFYESEVLSMIARATQLNVIGEKIIALLIENKIIHPDAVMWISHGTRKVGHAISVGEV